MANFVVQFPLKTEKYQEDILNKRFEIGRRIYNSLIDVTQKRYREMIKTKEYRNLQASLVAGKIVSKETWTKINDIHALYGISEYAFHGDVKKMQHHFQENIDSYTAQKIASELWRSYKHLLYKKGKKVHYKGYGQFNTLEGKSNECGIKFKDNLLVWGDLKIPVMIDYDNYYEYEALQCDICYCRIVRKFIRGKYKFYLQIVFNGIPPVKINKETGELKHCIGNGDVGLDIGIATIAVSSQSDVKILELADRTKNFEARKKELLEKKERSRRINNPENYNSDGTIKKNGNNKIIWKKSNHYIKYQNELKEAYRKQAAIRKYQHECLANYIISLGDNVYVEKMDFADLLNSHKKSQKYSEEKNKNPIYFKKIIVNKAPAMLLTIIDRKLKYHGKELIKINTYKARASQFNHFDQTYKKKPLSQRWNNFNGIKVQRDMYSAFLIMNIADDLESFNLEKCDERFETFYLLHNLEVIRLKGHRNLGSIAI